MLHGSLSYLLQDADGQVTPAHSISAGFDYPGVGPEHSYLRDTGRVSYETATDAEAFAAFQTSVGWRVSSRRSRLPMPWPGFAGRQELFRQRPSSWSA